MAVKVHEFYHISTAAGHRMEPFELWLNEAVTVHIEHEYLADRFGADYIRLQT